MTAPPRNGVRATNSCFYEILLAVHSIPERIEKMNGTLALWHEQLSPVPVLQEVLPSVTPAGEEDDSSKSKVELHFNLWREHTADLNFLDIGFRFKSVRKLRRFHLYVPTSLQASQIRDLSPLLKLGPTLNAIFNSVIDITDEGDDYFTTTEDEKHHVTIHQVTIGESSDIWLEPLENDDGTRGTVIVFSEALCARLRQHALQSDDHEKDQYLRIRLDLHGNAAELFSQEVTGNGGFFVSSLSRLELIEFRLNEKRSYPKGVAVRSERKAFFITSIHYFLIRDLQYHLLMQHETFRKVRRLEGMLWRNYLIGDANEEQLSMYEKVARRMVIYYWRKIDSNKPGKTDVEDFLAFASFRASISNLWKYAIGVIAIGGAGSAAAAACASYMKTIGGPISAWPNIATLILLPTLAFVLILSITALLRTWRRQPLIERPK